MKLHDFGWWYGEDRYEKIDLNMMRLYRTWYSHWTPNSKYLLFDGNMVAIKRNITEIWELTENSGVSLKDTVAALRYDFVPKPEDFEVIGEAP